MTTRWCWWRRARRRTRSTGWCARPSRAWRASRCACLPPPTGGSQRSRSRCRRTPGWSTGSPTRARCRCDGGGVPRRPRTLGAVARERGAGGGVPGRGRHGGERGTHPLGGRRACRCRAGFTHRAAYAWRCGACSPMCATRAGAVSCACGLSGHDGAAAAADAVEQLAARTRRASGLGARITSKCGLIAVDPLDAGTGRRSTPSRDADGAQRAKP